jgi:hypothetical protein
MRASSSPLSSVFHISRSSHGASGACSSGEGSIRPYLRKKQFRNPSIFLNSAAEINEPPQSPFVFGDAGLRGIIVELREPAPEPPLYETKSYFVTHQKGKEPIVTLFQTTHYAVSIDTLTALMEQAGFSSVHRVDDTSFAGMIVGHKPSS